MNARVPPDRVPRRRHGRHRRRQDGQEGIDVDRRLTVEGDRAAFRLLFGASARNDPEFADVVDGVLSSAAAAVSSLIEIEGSPEHRLVLAHAVVGIAEGISRHALTDPDGPHNPDQLANWVAELAWFGLRGVRSEA